MKYFFFGKLAEALPRRRSSSSNVDRATELAILLSFFPFSLNAPTPRAAAAAPAPHHPAPADAGMEGKAAETCARAREMHSTLPEARHCNRLLRLLVERLRWEDARKLYDEMLAEEGGADNYSTCAMVRGMCLEGRVEEGMKLIEARWGAECIPHAVFYNVPARGHWEGVAFVGRYGHERILANCGDIWFYC